jgi:DNA repair protein RecN (Recombination protein N)
LNVAAARTVRVLAELVVRDLGVIDELALVLGPGMTAVTGETGAGKTLVVGAIDLLTGGRADPSLVRPGADEAEIEGRFVLGDDEYVVRRVVPREGRSRAYINGRLASVGAVAELGVDLVDLHGQHAHQSLLKASVQRAALDRFGSVDTSTLEALLDDLRSLQAALAELGGDARARAREIDLLRHQVTEIEQAELTDGDEDRRLDAEESLLADAGAHRDAAAEVVQLLDADGPAAEHIGRAMAALHGRAPFVDAFDRLNAAAAELADLAADLRGQAEAIDDDPARLNLLRGRRQALRELRRKYGDTLHEVIEFGVSSAERLTELERHEERAAELDARRVEVAGALGVERSRVCEARREAAPRLAAAVESNLADLAMTGARLAIAVEGEAGEEVTICLAANAGHEPLPLARVASGGELARAMLALRLVLSAGPDTLVFDEVDAGVGGEAAQAVGRSLGSLTDHHQVLVVTHLAQVAAFADHHVNVSKVERGGVVVSEVKLLDPAERVVELSRMLSGSPESTSAREHAEELLAGAGRGS